MLWQGSTTEPTGTASTAGRRSTTPCSSRLPRRGFAQRTCRSETRETQALENLDNRPESFDAPEPQTAGPGTRGTIAPMTWLDTELARVLDPQYLDGLSERGLDEVRQMRSECEIAETAVSFLRRMAQGRLDLIHAYLDRRTRTEINDMRAFVDDLPSIIAAGPPPKSGPAHFAGNRLPDAHPEDLATELDAVLGADKMSELGSLDDDELNAIADNLAEMETRISLQRRALHEQIDRLQAEIVSRYKTGRATVDGLLS
jgi:hypothetical protein